jgi:hypothetical protein
MNEQVYVALGDTSSGWVQVVIMTTERFQHAVVFASDVYNPFPDLKKFLSQVQRNQLPAHVTINEERTEKTIVVRPVNERRGYVEFAVLASGDADSLDDVLLKCQVKRSDLVASFDRGIARWLDDGYDANKFGGGYGDEPACDVRKLWAKRLSKLPPRKIKAFSPRVVKLPKGFWLK